MVAIWITFGTPMQNHMLMTIKQSKSKSEVEFQYGGYELDTTYF